MPPRAFLERKPTSQTVKFGGRYINITHLATFTHLDKGYVSRVLRGRRHPPITLIDGLPSGVCVVLATALHMTLDEFQGAVALMTPEKLSKTA